MNALRTNEAEACDFTGLALVVLNPTHPDGRAIHWVDWSADPERNLSVGFQTADAAWAWRRDVGDDALLVQPVPLAQSGEPVRWTWYAEAIRGGIQQMTLHPYVCVADVWCALCHPGESTKAFSERLGIPQHAGEIRVWRSKLRTANGPRTFRRYIGQSWTRRPGYGTARHTILQAIVDSGVRIRVARLPHHNSTA